jgi:hypothetical protein
MGEVQGISFSKAVDQRAIVLNCVDFSNYWDTTYQYNFQGEVIGGRREAAFTGANTNLFTSPLGHGTGTLVSLLQQAPVSFKYLRGLLGGIVRVLEAIGGAYYGTTTFKGANDFTAIAELRLKLIQQIVAAEKDSSTASLFARKNFNNWMNRQTGSLGKLVTFRGVVQIMQSFIYHEVYPCPAAKFQPAVDGLKGVQVTHTSIEADKTPLVATFVTNLKALRLTNNTLKERLRAGIGTPGGTPPGLTDQLAVQEDFNELSVKFRAVKGVATPKPYEGKISSMDGDYTHAVKWLGSIATGLIDGKKISDPNRLSQAVTHLDNLSLGIIDILNDSTKMEKRYTYSKLSRVNNQIFRPDVWWAAAPRCNVIFPELYSSMSWQRNFLREVTRIELQTTNEVLGDDALFNGRYYAPDVEDMRNGLKLSSRQFGRLIMQHELLTGIIPMYEKMTEANLFTMKSRVTKSKGAKVPYAQRSVNFQYFKHRFASRSLSVSGRFNPWFVPGFPAVVIDRPMTMENLITASLPVSEQLAKINLKPAAGFDLSKADLLRQLVGPQYLGSCTQLSHSLSQAGGTTSYGMMQARVHREDVEYLGVDKIKISKAQGTGSKTTAVAAFPSNAPKVGGRGPNGGKITKVEVATDSYLGRALTRFGERGRLIVGALDSAGSDDLQASQPVQATDEIVPANEVQAYEIKEVYTRRTKVEVNLPIEEAIRPPWIWDGWSNLQIGETYQQFFGTGAITDVDGFAIVDTDTVANAEAVATTQEGKRRKAGASAGNKTENPWTGKKLDSGVGIGEYFDTLQQEEVDTTPDKMVSAITAKIIDEDRSIETSVDRLTHAYSSLTHLGLDVGAFIRNYTWRPVATMVEIMGSSDLVLEEKDGTIEATRGIEGFHSRAFSDVADLFGLVNPQVKQVLGLSKKASHATAGRLDVRKLRRDVVRDYVEELTHSRGLLG